MFGGAAAYKWLMWLALSCKCDAGWLATLWSVKRTGSYEQQRAVITKHYKGILYMFILIVCHMVYRCAGSRRHRCECPA